MTGTLDGLPALDTHAHIAPDVTSRQIRALGHSHTFAVTRTLDEAGQVRYSGSDRLTWGVGVHPGVPAAHDGYHERAFASLVPGFGLIGEVGLDRQAGNLSRQQQNLRSILRVAADHPVLISVHSTGATTQVLDLLDEHPHPGVILHWWTDDTSTLDRAVATGAFFSVNAAVKPTVLARIPDDRILTETDSPARRGGGRRPGDTIAVEHLLTQHWNLTPQATRQRLWTNLRRLATRAEALDRLPGPLAEFVERA